MLKEWPLVAFTILGQMAVGMSLSMFPLMALSAEISWNAQSREKALLVLGLIFGLLMVAAALSFFHLRHPLRARRVLANLRTSWLSREIFFELVLIVLVALAFVLVRTRNADGLFFRVVMAGAAIAGILFLVSMSKLYTLESVPSWDPVYTGISFLLTTVTLGTMATALVTGSPTGNPNSYLSTLWSLAFYFIAADIFLATFLTPRFGIVGPRPGPSLRPPARAPRSFHFGRLAFLAGGLVLLVLAAEASLSGSPGDLSLTHPLVLGRAERQLLTLASALVLLGEVVGRFLFYGLVLRPGD
jgi:anaerobic dimethyl sulfoxide reductase subunit C (anchor subunit)